MKLFKNTMKQCLVLSLFLFGISGGLWAQIEFEGLYSEGEGGAAWDADGSGDEPYGNGHGGISYYVASSDYVNSDFTSGAHINNIISGFDQFETSIVDHGYTMEQIKFKISLSDMGEDIQGMDYFTISGIHYANFYPIQTTFILDGYPLFEAIGDYSIYVSATGIREFRSGYMKVYDLSEGSPDEIQAISHAFLEDLGDEEIQYTMEVDYAAELNDNGRSGAYYDVQLSLEKGSQKLPFKGLNQDHEGFAGWDADGSGLEPYADGHGTQLYYGASLDYEDLDPDPNACLGHFLYGSTGFLNTLLQLEYNGLAISDLKLKMGLNSLGPDIQGVDWTSEYNNYYNNVVTFELNGEPILEVLGDTNKLMYTNVWMSENSSGKVYDISGNASNQAQNVAASLMKDIGTHSIKMISPIISWGSSFIGEGRDGAYYNIEEAYIKGVREKVSYINEGSVSGNWTLENSPYYIEGPLLIENEESLIIEEGVKIAIRGAYPIIVEGNIRAEGSEDLPIQFSSSNPNIYWDGFDYEGSNIISEEPSYFNHCLFQYGLASGGSEYNSGGAFAVRSYDHIEINNSTFIQNKAELSSNYVICGGAIALWDADIMVQKCIFHNNYAAGYGGAIMAYSNSNPIISNSLFYDNESDRGGAICFYQYSDGIMINNTIVNNTALYGGALYLYDHGSPEIINNIIWDNVASMSGSQVYFSTLGSYPGFYYNNIEEGLEGFEGNVQEVDYLFNMDEDPTFNDVLNFDFSIPEESPCVNQGTPDTSIWYYDSLSIPMPETCLGGFTREFDGCIDIGACEWELVSIEENEKQTQLHISIFPNPVHNNALIHYKLEEAGMVKIEVFNLMGQQVEQVFHTYQKAGEQSYHLQTGAYQRGPYLLKISTINQTHLSKFIKY